MYNEQQELLDEVYENYLQHYDDEYNEEQEKIQKNPLHWMEMRYTNIRPYPKEMFLNKCKTDPEFSERWGLKIEERELSLEERILIAETNTEIIPGFDSHFDTDEDVHKVLDTWNIPTKLITTTKITKIESYE
jgi:hypothetical protein